MRASARHVRVTIVRNATVRSHQLGWKVRNDHYVARFSGDCDISRYPQLHALLEAIPDDAAAVLIDLSGTTVIDSTALSELLLRKRRFDQAKQTVAVLVTHPNVYRVMALRNVLEKLNVFRDRENALRFLEGA
jgi:anti-anti-sigma factor